MNQFVAGTVSTLVAVTAVQIPTSAKFAQSLVRRHLSSSPQARWAIGASSAARPWSLLGLSPPAPDRCHDLVLRRSLAAAHAEILHAAVRVKSNSVCSGLVLTRRMVELCNTVGIIGSMGATGSRQDHAGALKGWGITLDDRPRGISMILVIMTDWESVLPTRSTLRHWATNPRGHDNQPQPPAHYFRSGSDCPRS